MAAFPPGHPGGMQQPGVPHGHPMGPGAHPNPAQAMAQPMMHPGVSGPGGGPHVSQAGPMMGMQPGMGGPNMGQGMGAGGPGGPGGPNAHAMGQLSHQQQQMMQQQQQQAMQQASKFFLCFDSSLNPSIPRRTSMNTGILVSYPRILGPPQLRSWNHYPAKFCHWTPGTNLEDLHV
jgi:hypothetical protein